MDNRKIEKRLAIIYTGLTLLGAITSITCGIAWSHWYQTLDQCIGRNCSCVLYGENTPTHFLGGPASSCIWVTYGPLIYVLFCIAFACFHGFRVLFASQNTVTRTVTTRNEVGEPVEMRAVHEETTTLLPRAFWLIISGCSVFFAVYAFVIFVTYVGGYFASCSEYRLTLEKVLGLHGTVIPVVHARLSCNAIFDFMDYVQPDSGRGYREGYIDTGLDLTTGVLASFFAWVLFCAASVFNIKVARWKD